MYLIIEVLPSMDLICLYGEYNMSEYELIEDICRSVFSIDRKLNEALFVNDIKIMASHVSGYDVNKCIEDAKKAIDFSNIKAINLNKETAWRYFKEIDEKTVLLCKDQK